MPKNVTRSRPDPRLLRVDFPRMEVDHRGLFLYFIDVTDAPTRQSIRRKPKITAAPDADILIPEANRRGRKLKNAMSPGSVPPGEACGVRNSVYVVSNGEHGRIEYDPFFGKDL